MSDTFRLSISHHFVNKENRAPERVRKDTGELSNLYAYAEMDVAALSPQQIVDHITGGKAICVAECKHRRHADNFIGSQIMGIDFDHGVDVCDLLRLSLIEEYAFLLYRTPSWTAEHPKSRALFLLDECITDAERYKVYIKRLLLHFNQANADWQCSDPVRLFFGSTQEGFDKVLSARLPLALLEALPIHPDELPPPAPAPRQAVDASNLNRAEKYALATREGIVNDALSTPAGAGLRHKAFNVMVMKLYAHENWTGFENLDSLIREIGLQMGRDEAEIERSIRGAKKEATRIPMSLPENAPQTHEDAPQAAPALMPVSSTPEPPKNALTWRTSDDSLLRFKERLLAAVSSKPPLVFPFRTLWEAGGFCRAVPAGILIGVLGLSGGMKTSFVETIIDKWRQAGANHTLWWGAEWTWEKMADRAIQRYSSVSLTDMMLHEMWLSEAAQDIPEKKRFGRLLEDYRIKDAQEHADKMMRWSGKNHYLDKMDTDIDGLLSLAEQRVVEQEQAGTPIRIAVFDYVQLLDLRSARSEGDRITQVLGRLKEFCVTHQLIGVVASQVTKAAGKDVREGDATLDGDAGQFQRSDKFNLVLTLNPVFTGGMLTNEGIIRVAKNSAGSAGEYEKRVTINPARFLWEDREVYLRSEVQPEPKEEIV